MTTTTRRRIHGTPYNFGTIRDITERKRREDELERQNERLESFAGIVSHDLRNPLTVAQGYLETAREDVDCDELRMVESALTRMGILIDDLLTLAREGHRIDEVRPVSLEEVASSAWVTVDSGDATLRIDDSPTIEADPTRLTQLLENLYRNAIEHGSTDGPSATADRNGSATEDRDGSATEDRDGSATEDRDGSAADVTVRVGSLDDEAGFYVADDGPGIPPDRRREVFALGVTTLEDGTGFGLAIVREIADGHGWESRVVESDAGGARFEFRVSPNGDGNSDSA